MLAKSGEMTPPLPPLCRLWRLSMPILSLGSVTRAERQDWLKSCAEGIDYQGLQIAYLMGKLKVPTGNFQAILKEPRIAGPIVKSFGLMQKLDTE